MTSVVDLEPLASALGVDVTSPGEEEESEAEWNGFDDDNEEEEEEDNDDDNEEEEEDNDDDDDDEEEEEDEEELGKADASDDFESDGDGVVSTRLRSSRRLRSGRSITRSIRSYFPAARDNNESDSDSDVVETHPPPTKKRTTRSTKRKKRSGDSSSDGDNDERGARHKRRNIADVRGDEELDASTRKARDAERLRASHIVDFEQLADVEVLPAGPAQEPLVCLNVRMDGSIPSGEDGTDDAPVFVHASVSGKLKKHQVVGTRFLWSHVAVEPVGFGCVLADFMGLGKTLQVITVVQAFLAKKRLNRDGLLVPRHKHVLILAPTICVRNWEAEVVKWVGKKEARRLGLATLESSREKTMADRVRVVRSWHKRGGVLVMGYELYRILVLQASGEAKIAAGNAKHAAGIKQLYTCLAKPGPDLIVLDEGHRVRDHKSKLVKALAHVETPRRIILTGYPLQNHLEEYWTMVNFARPDYLGTLEEFKNRFVDPIKNGQCIDSSEADLRLARQRAYVLTRELKPLVLRRDQQFLFRQLPPKKEWVLLCKLSEPQKALYRRFLQHGVPTRRGGNVDVLGGYHISMAIANHPDVLAESFHALEHELKKNPSKFASAHARFNLLGEDVDGPGDVGLFDAPSAATTTQRRRKDDSDASDGDDDDMLDALAAPRGQRHVTALGTPQHRLSFASDFLQSYETNVLETSAKMVILMALLAECREIGDRVILFSQSIPTLNTIEKMIAQANRRSRHSRRLAYLRIDGSTPAHERFRMIGQFNDLEEDVDLILISTKAGGEGINLCAGNRVVIFDVCWNPSNDAQSMCRSYRFGQTKPVFVYRFVTTGTMEKKVYDLQIFKEGVSKRVVDDKTTERKYKLADRQKYFDITEFEDALKTPRKTTAQEAPGAIGGDRSGTTTTERSTPETDAVLQRVLAKFNALGLDGDSAGPSSATATAAASSSPDTDSASTTASTTTTNTEAAPDGGGGGWILDWFEQETMFEEDLDQQCSPLEQKEIMESHLYLKSMRRLRQSGGSHLISREGVLFVKCPHCGVTNDVFPEATTSVPVPTKIDCSYCRNPVPTAGATTVPPPPTVPHAGYGHRGFSGSMLPGVGQQPPPTGPGTATPMVVDAGTHTLPPHLHALVQQQQQQLQEQQRREDQRILEMREREQQLAIETQRRKREQDAARRRERQAYELKDRCLLVLRRGMTGCQELKRRAEACGAKIAIEVNPQTTDVVSAMSAEETLKFLKLHKLPSDVELRDDAWLRAEIAKANGETETPTGSATETPETPAMTQSPLASRPTAQDGLVSASAAEGAAPSASEAGDRSSETIDLFDSDNEGDDPARPSAPTPVAQAPAAASAHATSAGAAEDGNDDYDDDVIEIL